MATVDCSVLRIDDETRQALRKVVEFDPKSETTFECDAQTADLIRRIAVRGVIRRAHARPWGWSQGTLTTINIMKDTAKAILNEVGDNPGQGGSGTWDIDRETLGLVEAHIRSACYFRRGGRKHIRAACIVNKQGMNPERLEVAEHLVYLMNETIKRIGRPVSYSEYLEMHGH